MKFRVFGLETPSGKSFFILNGKPQMILGMDFGTTNTGAARFDGKRIQLLPLDPASPTPHICRSAIYMTRAGDYFLGSTALDTYFAQNVGRPTRYRKVWVGEILQVFAELPYFYRDVYVYEDEFSPGRLFTSIKSALRNQEYYGTSFQGNWYSPSDLVAVFLMGMKMRLERHLDAPITEIVLGRPVHFSRDPSEDNIAQGRLLDAAFKAGFEKVFLESEPVAAALSYERTLQGQEVVLVFDFGGGTLDFTIMEMGGAAKRQILATGGIPIAGDVFDQRLFRTTIPKHLGEGDYFAQGGAQYPIPAHIFDTLTQPHEILTLNAPHNLEMLREIHQGALHKEKTQALLKVVSSNYALLLYALVERAKTRLSTQLETTLELERCDVSLKEVINRATFEGAIASEYESIRQELLATVERAGLRLQDIDRVIRTGGSSQIPLFVGMLNHLFGPDKVRAIDVFSSVTSGLAIRARQIETGLESLPVYTSAAAQRSREGASQRVQEREARQIDLDVVQRYLRIQQEIRLGHVQVPSRLWLVLEGDQLRALAAENLDSFEHLTRDGLRVNALEPYLSPEAKAVLAAADDEVVLTTNRFKLILVRIADLHLAQLASSTSVNHALPMENDEYLTTLALWKADHAFLCMVTSTGQGRAFDTPLIAEHLSQKPYFQLERRYAGIPLALFPANRSDRILVGTNSGRLGRAEVEEMSLAAYEMLKIRQGEIVTAAGAVSPQESILILGAQGTAVPFDPHSLPADVPPTSRGATIGRNCSIVGFFPNTERPEPFILALTDRARLLQLDLPRGYISESRRLTRLKPGETILSCLKIAQNRPIVIGSE
jgi:hypothetical chaperone protein